MTSTRPPGPAGDRFTGNLTDFTADRLAFLAEAARRYGDVVSLGSANVLLADPGDIERVLVNRDGAFVKVTPQARRGRRHGFPQAMMNSEGRDWQVKRTRLQPGFSRGAVADIGPRTLGETERMTAGWRPGQRVDLHSEVARVTLRVVTRLMFGVSPDEQDAAVIARLVETIMRLSVTTVAPPRWVPTPTAARMGRATRALAAILDRMGAGPDARGGRAPLLHALLTADPRPTPGELRDELATLVMSGYETTTDAVVWACFLLARHPAAARQVAGEAESASAGGLAGTEALPYTRAVVREALRLYPPAWITGRETAREVEVRGFVLPPGTAVAVSQWVTHRDPRFHDRPAEFVPDRWLAPAPSLPRGAYFPFGLGPRACIGASVALTEATLVVAAIWRRYRLTLPEGTVVRPRPALALQPAGAIFAVLPHQSRS